MSSKTIEDISVATSTTHILVIRLSAMGDVAMTVPVLRIVVQTYPNVKITVVTKKAFEPIFMGIDNVSVYIAEVSGRHKGIFGLNRLAKEVRNLGIDAVADLHNVLRSNVLRNLFALRNIKVAQIDKGRDEKKALIKAKGKVFEPLKSMHQRYADVFENLGFPIDLDTYQAPEKPQLSAKINALTETSTKKWLGIAPFAQYESKTYPYEQIVEVIRVLSEENQIEIFLFGGGKREKDILNVIASKYKNVTNVVGQLSFQEELSLIGNLDGMLSMDSGNGHLAAIYNIPVITLWGVTHPYLGFVPFGQPLENSLLSDTKVYNQIPTSVYGNKFPEGYENVMQTIAPQTVTNAIKEILQIS